MQDQYQRYPSLASQKSPSDVLSDAAILYGLLLSYDPHVIMQARNALYDTATITSNPTEEGVKEIDGSHALFGLQVQWCLITMSRSVCAASRCTTCARRSSCYWRRA